MNPSVPLLAVRRLTVQAAGRTLVKNLDLTIGQAESVGLVGPSGSGKSLTASAVIGLLPPGLTMSGSVCLLGHELVDLPDERLCEFRGTRMALIPQDPLASLTPTRTVGSMLEEVIRRIGMPGQHRPVSRRDARQRAMELLDGVGIPDPAARLHDYPHEFSGGMRQRVAIALAVAHGPDLVIADEPTSALDAGTGDRILDLLHELRDRERSALLLISHDQRAVDRVCDRVLTMRDGRLVAPGVDVVSAAVPAVRVAGAAGRGDTVLSVTGLAIVHRRGGLQGRQRGTTACADVSFTLARGEAVALVGPSGSGKTSVLNAILAGGPPERGRIEVEGIDYAAAGRAGRRRLRRKLAAVFQDPADSLNPRMRIADIIAEPLRLQGFRTVEARVVEVLDAVRLPREILARRPGTLSGGQQQRVAIARALTLHPAVLLLDEPVSSLDAELRIEILSLLDDLRRELELTYLMVSHDLELVGRFADRTIALTAGRIADPTPKETDLEVVLDGNHTAAAAAADVRSHPSGAVGR